MTLKCQIKYCRRVNVKDFKTHREWPKQDPSKVCRLQMLKDLRQAENPIDSEKADANPFNSPLH